MTETARIYLGGPVFDGRNLLHHHAALFKDGRLARIAPLETMPEGIEHINLRGQILSPGYMDLQVNGGDGIMLNEALDCEGLRRIASAHRKLGAVSILPTLITDTPQKIRGAIAATRQAIAEGLPGIAGLHLEGPHLSVARKGAHDATLIRPMTNDDMDLLLQAAQDLPVLMVTIAPENVTLEQADTLAQAGVILSLGHTDASYDEALAYAGVGVRAVTHLFNAMSQLGNRAPGVVGAALDHPGLSAGLIADGIHVHPASLRSAWAAKKASSAGQGEIFLVSDAMAPAGTSIDGFELEGRYISRQEGRLTLQDGTLAGADLDLTTALKVLTENCGVPLEQALVAATGAPRRLVGAWEPGDTALGMGEDDFISIEADLSAVSPLTCPAD